MNSTRILIANEFESYREALAEAFRTVYPDLDVYEAEPYDLDRKVGRLSPGIVVCSNVTALVRKSVPIWVELYPECAPESTVSVRGRRREVQSIELQELLDLVDQAKTLA